MKILDIKSITGPNFFHHKPVLVMTIDLGELAEISSAEMPFFSDRLINLLPGLIEHHCSLGRRGGFTERLQTGTYLAHIIEHIAIELSQLLGEKEGYGKTIFSGKEGVYKVAVRYRSEPLMRQLLYIATDLADHMRLGKDFDLWAHLNRAKELGEAEDLGPSTRAILAAAERRDIPWRRLNEFNLVQLGYGKNRRLIQATCTDRTSMIATEMAQDKECTKAVLREALVPVPRGEKVSSEEQAIAAFRALTPPLAVKPVDGNQGKGVSLQLNNEQDVRDAFRIAAQYSKAVVIEEQIPGDDYRILVVGGNMVAAARRTPAHVVGDGASTIRQLIEEENKNPLRGNNHSRPLSKILLDEVTEGFLSKQNITADFIAPMGTTVYLRETANLSTGGTATDVTEEVHPEIVAVCERASRVIGLDICGIDLVCEKISLPLHKQRAAVIEVNASPGIRMHHYPYHGKPRDAGGAILQSLFPPEAQSRIPIISVTGTNGKTTIVRLISHILSQQGIITGLTSSDGIYVGQRRVANGDTSGPSSARAVLCDSAVEVAVLETARGGIVRSGLGYDWADIALITNIQADHIGQDGIEDLDDILKIKRLVAERVKPGGTLVLNADDPKLTGLARKLFPDGSRHIVYFSQHANHLEIIRQLTKGGIAYYLKNGWLYENQAGIESALIKSEAIPLTYGGTATFHVLNALAAIACCRAFGLKANTILRALDTFSTNHSNLGRTNLFRVPKGHVLVDYGHNPEAIRAVGNMVSRWNTFTRTAVLGVPGDRADQIIRLCGQAAAENFDKVIIREDEDLRGRDSGEAAAILAEEVKGKIEYSVQLDQTLALEQAINQMQLGEVIVFFYEKRQVVEAVLKQFAAKAVEEFVPVNSQASATRNLLSPGAEAYAP